jgi:predicted nucleotidyltransferase component of viral defense system
MAIPFPEQINLDSIFLWLMHRIAEVFQHHAILKGGMAFRLLDSPRSTVDLDYVFIPYHSKKDILSGLKSIVDEIPDAKIDILMHSKSLRINIYHRGVSLQIEANVALECKSQEISTLFFARKVDEPSRVIRVMDFSVALSHKLAAWNERRLLRDLFDAYFLYKIVGVLPEQNILKQRLENVDSRIPRFKNVKKMTLSEFREQLKNELQQLKQKKLENELSALMKKEELPGLEIKIRTALNELLDKLSTGV